MSRRRAICKRYAAPWLVTLGAICLGTWRAAALAADATPAGGPFRLEAEVSLSSAVQAVAINADESLVAAASAEGPAARVTILDRRSRSVLGVVEATVGTRPTVAFAPHQDLLLIVGQEALELWNISAASLSPDKPLAPDYRLWRQPLEGDGEAVLAGFAGSPPFAVWVRGNNLYARGAQAESPAPDQPVFRSAEPLAGFAAGRVTGALALFSGGKELLRFAQVPAAGAPAPAPEALKGHRFPVSAAAFLPHQSLLSLDAGRNLIPWSENGQPGRIEFLKALPEDSRPEGLWALKADKLIVQVTKGAEGRLVALDGASRRAAGVLSLGESAAVAVSPTGRYVITAVQAAVRIFQSSFAISPVDYVRQLRQENAIQTALSYARMLDPDTVPAPMKRQLEQELSRVPTERVLAELVERMREAVQAGDAAAIQQWAEQVLNLQPGEPEALAALARVEELRHRAVLGEAQQAFEAGSYRTAIELLVEGIPERSPVHGEAARLIKDAEQRRDIGNTLEQARQKMELELFAAAETLVNEVLRRDPENRAALLLAAEIRNRSGSFAREALGLAAGILIALGAIIALLYRYRETWRGLLRPLSLEQEPLRPFPGTEIPRPRAHAGARGPAPEAERGPSPGTRPPPGASGAKARIDEAARLSQARDEMRKAEEMLRLSRRNDRYQEYTAWFLELEAELNTLARRLQDPKPDPDRILPRLQRIIAELRDVKFSASRRPGPSGPGAANGEDPDYYQILRVSSGASEADIKAAYHKLIKEYHPDRHSGSEFSWVREESERMTRKLSEAYQVLSDTGRREQYDRELARRRRTGA